MMSCSSDAVLDDDKDIAEQGLVQIHFTIDMAGTTTGTRATWGDNYESVDATYNENAIETDKFQVLVFDTSGNYLDQLANLSFTRDGDNGSTYNVVGTLNVDNSYVGDYRLSCKLVVLANYDNSVDVSQISTLSDIGTNKFAYSNHTTEKIATGTACIPMFGVHTVNNMLMNAGYQTDAGTIYMLRAMAKIRVQLHLDTNKDGSVSSDEKFAITSVSLSNCSQYGYIVPNGFASVDKNKTTDFTMDDPTWNETNSIWNDDTFNPYYNPHTSSYTLSTTTLNLVEESDTLYYVYVPEYDISSSRPQFNIRFDFQTDESESNDYTFGFGEYDSSGSLITTNTDCNIERNHTYTFVITKKKGKLYFALESNYWANIFTNEFEYK